MNALDIRIAKTGLSWMKTAGPGEKSDSLAQQLIQLMSAKADIQALDDGFKNWKPVCPVRIAGFRTTRTRIRSIWRNWNGSMPHCWKLWPKTGSNLEKRSRP